MSKNWRQILVSPRDSIRSVLKVIDEGSLRFAIVTDEDLTLLGTVSDGDVRRALIRGDELESAIESIMFTQPTTLRRPIDKNAALRLMDEKEISAIPIVEGNKIVGLHTLHDSLHEERKENPVFLMAGGFGTRLRPLTDNCPKPMLKVGDRPIMETVFLQFVKAGFHNFYVSTHYLPHIIRDYFGDGSDWGVSITYIHEEKPLGTGGAIGLLPRDLPDLPLLVMNCDILTKLNLSRLLEFHNESCAKATMCVREYEYTVPFGVVESSDNFIQRMIEKPTYHYRVNAGIYVLGSEVVSSVKGHEYLDMPSLLEQFIEDKVATYPFHEYWLDIGRIEDFRKAQSDIVGLGI